MKKVITDNTSERIEVKTDEVLFSIVTTFKGHLPKDINDRKVFILNRAEAIRIYDLLGQWIRREAKY